MTCRSCWVILLVPDAPAGTANIIAAAAAALTNKVLNSPPGSGLRARFRHVRALLLWVRLGITSKDRGR